jgi:O-antigen/teichoic acid export membrane protein
MVTFCRYLWSAILVSFFVAAFELLLIQILIHFAFVPFLVGESSSMDASLITDANIVLFLVGVNWVATLTFTGFFVRALEAHGQYARLAWWGVFHLVLSQFLPAIAVIFGANFLQAGVVYTVGSIICYLPIYYDMFRLMKRERIVFIKPYMKVGVTNFMRSTALTGKIILDNLRQQGVRLVLAPVAGAVGLAAFSTMRTGANVALQGLNSITNPLMPDLMRFLHDRDQLRVEAGFSTIWVVVVVLISPAVIVLQALAPPLFELWTHGKIQFDPLLFAFLSLSVLIFAIAQPAIAVVMGNNMVRPQLVLTSLSAGIVVALVVGLVPLFGLAGAGLAIVASEIAAMVGYVITARSWLMNNDLRWPTRSFNKAAISVIVSAATMIAIALFPEFTYLLALIGISICMWNFASYWKTLPPNVRSSFKQVTFNLVKRIKGALSGVIRKKNKR